MVALVCVQSTCCPELELDSVQHEHNFGTDMLHWTDIDPSFIPSISFSNEASFTCCEKSVSTIYTYEAQKVLTSTANWCQISLKTMSDVA